MFFSHKRRIQALLDVVDDMLVGAPGLEQETIRHPHHRTVRLRLERRAGTVAPGPMRCLSPVRHPAHVPEAVRVMSARGPR